MKIQMVYYGMTLNPLLWIYQWSSEPTAWAVNIEGSEGHSCPLALVLLADERIQYKYKIHLWNNLRCSRLAQTPFKVECRFYLRVWLKLCDHTSLSCSGHNQEKRMKYMEEDDNAERSVCIKMYVERERMNNMHTLVPGID